MPASNCKRGIAPTRIEPLLKWPGGKRWLAPQLAPMLAAECQGRYFEPFLGGGAVFLALQPARAVLSDNNAELIESLDILRSRPEEVLERLWRLSNSADCYYNVRASRPTSEVGAAARFFYLNRTCWGGIYRLNRRGEFNVPFGDSGRVICRKRDLEENARSLGRAKLLCRDFESSMRQARTGDVIYADPPYTTKGQDNGFVRYNERLFAWKDQTRLAKAAQEATVRGAFVAVSGPWHEDIFGLYRGWWKVKLNRASNVAVDPAYRGHVQEAVFFSRKPSVLENGSASSLRCLRIAPRTV